MPGDSRYAIDFVMSDSPPTPVEAIEQMFEGGQFDQALAKVTGLETSSLTDDETVYLEALVDLHLGDLGKASELARKAVHMNGEVPNYYWLLGMAASRQGDQEKAIQWHQRALEVDAGFFKSALQLGFLFEKRGLLETASEAFEQAWRLRRDNVEAVVNLLFCSKRLGRFRWAMEFVETVIGEEPENWRQNASFLGEAGYIYLQSGFVDRAIEFFESALKLDPNLLEVASRVLYATNLTNGLDEEAILEMHRSWPMRLPRQSGHTALVSGKRNLQGKKLRIGFVSSDFCFHSISYFLPAFFKRCDRDRFEILCFSDTSREDDMTRLYQSHSSKWVNLNGLGTGEALEAIRADQVDILVDLAGHTTGKRTELFHLRAAPIQVTFLGCPNTTGIPNMDFRISDAIIDPPSEGNRFSTEQLIRIPDGMHCFFPDFVRLPEVGESSCLKNGFITFGSFNSHIKISKENLAAWKTVLDVVPNARLLLKSNFIGQDDREMILACRLQQAGIAGDRFEILPRNLSLEEHLQCYHRVDIALDTFPYNGTTTTCESLIMGVPVVTWSGSRPCARTGASLLASAGLSSFCGDTIGDYVKIAEEIAADPRGLAQTRNQLRERVLGSLLCDTGRWVRKMEDVLVGAWEWGG